MKLLDRTRSAGAEYEPPEGLTPGEAGTLMREMAPGAGGQLYYLVKALEPGTILSAAQHGALKEAERLAAGNRAGEQD